MKKNIILFIFVVVLAAVAQTPGGLLLQVQNSGTQIFSGIKDTAQPSLSSDLRGDE